MTRSSSDSVYYPYFDYLRITLACIVMLGHDQVIPWKQSGNLAVQLFFALSGWLIGGILLRISTRDLPKFYTNRALRIWAPYYIALIFLMTASMLRDQLSWKWVEIIFYKASFVYNIFGTPQLADYSDLMPLHGTGNHFWSVNAEEQFYLVAPLLLVVAAGFSGRRISVWLALALAAWWFNVYASIVLGVLAALVIHHLGDVHRKFLFKAILLIVGLSTSLGIVAGFDYSKTAPLLAISVVLLLAVPGNPSALGKLLGGMSYPLYLNHWMGVFLGNALLAPFGLRDSPERKVLAGVISLGIAALLYWYVDRRLQAVRENVYTEFRGKLCMLISYGMIVVGIAVGWRLTHATP